jgi:hypothetical protein
MKQTTLGPHLQTSDTLLNARGCSRGAKPALDLRTAAERWSGTTAMPCHGRGGHRSARTAAALVALALASGIASSAWGAPGNGLVEGDIALPPAGVEEPHSAHQGYIPRIKNPITELRPFDPRPECFVYLDGGPADADAGKATSSQTLKLGVAAFSPPLLPVVLGTDVVIKNTSRTTHPIYSPEGADVLDSEAPIGAGGDRKVAAKQPFQAIRLLSRDAPHLEGRVIAVPTKYFARLERNGSFKIDDVPPGKWTIKIWYRDGWLPTTQVVDVVAKGTPRVKITLPERVAAKPPAAPEQDAKK